MGIPPKQDRAPDAPADPPMGAFRDLSKQYEWHEYFRDCNKNQYRTSYLDHIGGREVSCKSDMPAGYGGHCPSVSHDILFDNTAFARLRQDLQDDPQREKLPDFSRQMRGLPVSTLHPRGPKFAPHYKTRTMAKGLGMACSQVEAPWAVTPLEPVPTFRDKVTPLRPEEIKDPPQRLKNLAAFQKYAEGLRGASPPAPELELAEPAAPEPEPAAPAPAESPAPAPELNVTIAEPELKPRPHTAPAARRIHTPVQSPDEVPAQLGGLRPSRKGSRPMPGGGVAPCVDSPFNGLGVGIVKRTDLEVDGVATPRGLGLDLLQRMHATPTYAAQFAINGSSPRSQPSPRGLPPRAASPVTPRACTSPYTPRIPERPATCEPMLSPREVLPPRASSSAAMYHDARYQQESPLLARHEIPRCTPGELRAAAHMGRSAKKVVVTSQPVSPRSPRGGFR